VSGTGESFFGPTQITLRITFDRQDDGTYLVDLVSTASESIELAVIRWGSWSGRWYVQWRSNRIEDSEAFAFEEACRIVESKILDISREILAGLP